MVFGIQEALNECVLRDPTLILCICSHCYGYSYEQGMGTTEFISPMSDLRDPGPEYKVHGLCEAGSQVTVLYQTYQGD